MLEGLSTNRRCESMAACLVAAGQRFVIRYHSARTTQSEKRLHPREAEDREFKRPFPCLRLGRTRRSTVSLRSLGSTASS